MSMRQESTHRLNIDPYYKGNVFERDQAYYSQMLTGTRRTTNLRGSQRQSSLQRVDPNDPPRSPSPPSYFHTHQSPKEGSQYPRESTYQRSLDYTKQNEFGQREAGQGNQAFYQALEKNRSLRQQLQSLVSGNTEFGHSDNVIKLSHYNFNQHDMGKIRQQENQIKRLETLIQANQSRIQNYKKAGQQLGQRMGNIQSIDKEIYKTLQGSVNRDKQLLERASSALARGERREDVAKILQQVIA